MRVLMISHMYPSPVNPTGGIFVHEQVRALIDRGHEVRVVSPKGWAPPGLGRWKAYRDVVPEDTLDGVVVHYPRKLTLPGGRLGHRNADAFLAGIRRTVRRIHHDWPFDVIHAHMMVPDGWAAARMARELGVPAVGTAHRADVLDVPAEGRLSRMRVAEAIQELDAVITVSRAIGDAADAIARPRRPITVVPNGADAEVFLPRDAAGARERLGIPDDGPVVSYVGKLVPRKGVDTLIESMGLLQVRGGAPRLVMAGIGGLREPLEQRAAQLGVADRITWLGKVPHHDVGWVMSTGDVFVLPSLSEGLPTVVCEAMACGLPVVATAVDGTPEIVDDPATGLLVRPHDAEGLADALARVLGDAPLRAAMGAEALRRSEADYTWAANAARMEAVYEMVIRG
ncbi:MAG: glycosyltransferase family 4 protein [Actinobacteria bacterium]|nr:glycosyltransferase family 4 protein [Actinomycetota bacterium]MBM3697118.1 glycosyltransferase family 4 protein [Actinomycetota bacterium]